MTPDLRRPSLLRSPILWLGLVVLIFLGWAWRDSVGRWSHLQTGRTHLQSRASGVVVWHVSEQSPGWDFGATLPDPSIAPPAGFPRWQELFKPRLGRPEIGRPLQAEEARALRVTGELDGRKPDPVLVFTYWLNFRLGGAGSWVVFIPYWCLMLAVLVPWLGLIYWRHRRMN